MLFGKKDRSKQNSDEKAAKQDGRTKTDDESQQVKKYLSQFETSVRPGGVFAANLLMKEKCAMPDEETMLSVLSKHLGEVEVFGTRIIASSFALKQHMANFKDASVPVQIMISECDEFAVEKINDVTRSQMWDCINDRDQILSECRYSVLLTDMLGGGLPARERADVVMDYLEAALELYPQCEAVYFMNTGKLILADDIRNSKVEGMDRFIRFVVNVRFFNIEGTQDHVVDTLGMSLLWMEDQQYHFHGMDPNWVVNHAYNMASYRLGSDRPFKDGETIDGIRDGQIVQDIAWKCRFEDALIGPARPVLDVFMNEYASGNRG